MDETTARLISVAIEAPAAALMVAIMRWPIGHGPNQRRPDWRGPLTAAAVAALGTLASHPFAWPAILALMPRLGYAAAVAAVELAVILAEAALYGWILELGARRALALSAIANGASLGIGLVVHAVMAG